jgi:transposase
VLEGLRGEDSIAELCRKEGINQNLYYRWSKEFLEAGKKRLAGDTAGARMPVAELREQFVSRRLVGQRLATMATNGFLIDRGDGYALSAKGRATAAIFSWVKQFWRLGSGG